MITNPTEAHGRRGRRVEPTASHRSAISSVSGRLRVALAAPAPAGLAYVAAWIVGLAIWPSNPAVTDSGREVVSDYGAHRTLGAAQFLLVEGVAAIALAFVIVPIARAAGRGGAARVILITGLTACLISLPQCVLGVVLATSLASPAHTRRAGQVLDLINRLDGVKMLVLATVIITAALARRELALPRWLSRVGVLAALALVVSGAGYLALDGALATAASVSLPLLLLWVSANGLALGRREAAPRRQPRHFEPPRRTP